MKYLFILMVCALSLACQDKQLAQKELSDPSEVIARVQQDPDYENLKLLHRDMVVDLASGILDLQAMFDHRGAYLLNKEPDLDKFCDVSLSDLDKPTAAYLMKECQSERIWQKLLTKYPEISGLSPEDVAHLQTPHVGDMIGDEHMETIIANRRKTLD